MPEPFQPGLSPIGTAGPNGGPPSELSGVPPEAIAAQIAAIMGMGQQPAQPQEEPPPLPPDPAFQEIAFKYISEFCRTSYWFVKQKEPTWKLIQDLAKNRISIKEWRRRYRQISRTSRGDHELQSGAAADNDDKPDIWTDFVYSPAYFIHRYCQNAYPQIFDGPEWLTVIAEDTGERPPGLPQLPQPQPWGIPIPTGQPPQEPSFPVGQKAQRFLLKKCDEGKIEQRIYELLQSNVWYGAAYAQIFPHEEWVTKPVWQTDPRSGAQWQDEQEELVASYPVLQLIPLNRTLPDPISTHNDLQRWRGFGHRVDRTYDEILADFDSGLYHLNRDKFEEMGKGLNQRGPTYDTFALDYDPDVDVQQDQEGWFCVWVWHGRVPTPTGFKECCASIVTDKDVEDPTSGILIRLTTEPVLKTGKRPFVNAVFIPDGDSGAFGSGIVEHNQDILYLISQFVGQLQDNTRLTAIGAYQCLDGSPAWDEIIKDGCIIPGKVYRCINQGGDIYPVKTVQFNGQTIQATIDWLANLLERRTSITDPFQGMASRKETATGAQIQQQQSMRPTTTITDMFVRNLVEPMGNIMLAFLQQTTFTTQTFTIKGPNGQDIPIQITPEELQQGKYYVACTLTHQDHTRMAKAQAVQQVMTEAMQLQQYLMTQEMTKVSISELFKRWIDLIGVDGSDRIIQLLGSQEQALVQQLMMLSQQNQQLQAALAEKQQAEQQVPAHSHGNGNGNGNGKAQEEAPLGSYGGPMGDSPMDANYAAQLIQESVRPGSPGQQ